MHTLYDLFDVIVYVLLAVIVAGGAGFWIGHLRGALRRERSHRHAHAFRVNWRNN